MAAAGVVVTVEIARRIFPLHLPLERFYGVVAGLALYNLVVWLVARRLGRSVPGGLPTRADALVRVLLPRTLRGTEIEGEAIRAAAFTSVRILIDTIALALLLHFSGGIENPFLYFFVFHLIISSILLSRRATYLQASLALVLISAVAVGELAGILRHYPLEGVWQPGSYQDPMLVGAQLLVLGTTLGIAAYMGSTIAVRLRIRQRDAMLLSRQVADKAEELRLALDRLRLVEQAKSQYMRKVAHELRGPLGTIQTSLKVALQDRAGGLSERVRDMIGQAERRAGELAELTADLLVPVACPGGRPESRGDRLPAGGDRHSGGDRGRGRRGPGGGEAALRRRGGSRRAGGRSQGLPAAGRQSHRQCPPLHAPGRGGGGAAQAGGGGRAARGPRHRDRHRARGSEADLR